MKGAFPEEEWIGNVILEYLHEFHSQMLTDIKFLEDKYNKYKARPGKFES